MFHLLFFFRFLFFLFIYIFFFIYLFHNILSSLFCAFLQLFACSAALGIVLCVVSLVGFTASFISPVSHAKLRRCWLGVYFILSVVIVVLLAVFACVCLFTPNFFASGILSNRSVWSMVFLLSFAFLFSFFSSFSLTHSPSFFFGAVLPHPCLSPSSPSLSWPVRPSALLRRLSRHTSACSKSHQVLIPST